MLFSLSPAGDWTTTSNSVLDTGELPSPGTLSAPLQRMQHRFLAPGLAIVAAPDAAALPNKQGRILDGLQATHDDTENTTDLGKEDKRVEPHLGNDLGEEEVGDNDDEPFPFRDHTFTSVNISLTR